jgi:signal transduction histidine kinase
MPHPLSSQSDRLERERLEQLGLATAAVSHDFNNLLAEISGYCSLALHDPANAQANLVHLKNATGRAEQLCRQLMDYAAGKFTLAPVAIDRILCECLAAFGRQYVDVSIHYSTGGDVPQVLGNLVECRRIFANLFKNAAEAMDYDGKLAVSVELEDCPARRFAPGMEDKNFLADQYVVISISDTGCGMDDISRRRIFEPDFTTKQEGHGLGLHAVIAAMREHHGAIDCQSKPGFGTTFTLFFPVGQPSAN